MFAFEETERCIYVLKLEDDYFYVGQTETERLEKRVRMHGTKKGAAWTLIHRPVALHEVLSVGNTTEKQARLEENKVTLQYMESQGWRKVRGGIASHLRSHAIRRVGEAVRVRIT